METKSVLLMRGDCEFQDGSYPCDYEDGGKLPDCELCHKICKAKLREVGIELEKTVWLRKHHSGLIKALKQGRMSDGTIH